jgi:hypothetical protein
VIVTVENIAFSLDKEAVLNQIEVTLLLISDLTIKSKPYSEPIQSAGLLQNTPEYVSKR